MNVRSALLGAFVLLVSTLAGCVLPEAVPAEEPVAKNAEASVSEENPGPVAPASASAEPAAPPADPHMSGELVSDETTVSSCMTASPAILDGAGGLPIACADRRIVIAGNVHDIALLPAVVSTFHGVVKVTAVEGDAWGIQAVLSATGLTEDQARENLEKITFEWSHVDGSGAYSLAARAFAQSEQISIMSGKSADIYVTMPAAVPMDLKASSAVGRVEIGGLRGGAVLAEASSGDISLADLDMTNVSADVASGDVIAENITSQGLDLSSSSGSVVAARIDAIDMRIATASGDAYLSSATTENLLVETQSGDQTLDDVTVTALKLDAASGDILVIGTTQDAIITTSSGDIFATLVPRKSGSFQLYASSGSLDLGLPEGDSFGYTIEAESSSGDSDVFLEDGKATTEDEVTRFVTDGFEDRAIQTLVSLEASSGSIRVFPADG